jgi:hypothetical protein
LASALSLDVSFARPEEFAIGVGPTVALGEMT